MAIWPGSAAYSYHDLCEVDGRVEKMGDKIEISSSFVMDCLKWETLGDGLLFAALHEGMYVYNADSGCWLSWQGHHWVDDIKNKSLSAVEAVAIRYAEEIKQIDQDLADAYAKGEKDRAGWLEAKKKELDGRVKKLRRVQGRINCREFAGSLPVESSMVIGGDELDQNEWLLGMPNGVMDLRIGEMRPGRPNDYISKSCNPSWAGIDASCPTWEKFLSDSIDHEETIRFLQRWAGYCLTAITSEQKFLILSGDGRNGKGIFTETMLEVMGDYAGPIQAEMLLDQGRGGRSSNGATPDVMGLKGRRLAAASESEENRRVSTSKVKWFTGQDTMVGRNPYDRHETLFTPSHKLMLMTNNDPQAPGDDYAFWDRTLKVNWPYKFVDVPRHDDEKQRDVNLRAKLHKELAGILAWAVRGCLEWQRRGLDPPGAVKEAVAGYQRESDLVQDFIDGRCFVDLANPTLKTAGADMYSAFKIWYQEFHHSKCPSITWFGRRMGKKFKKRRDDVRSYLGVGIIDMSQ